MHRLQLIVLPLFLMCAISATMMASTIQVTFQTTQYGVYCDQTTYSCVTEYGQISSDLNGDGINETTTPLLTPTSFTIMIASDFFAPTVIASPGESRFWSATSNVNATIAATVLNSASVLPLTSGNARRDIGFGFSAMLAFSGNDTAITNGIRYDNSASVSWYQQFSNDIVETVQATPQACYPPPTYQLDVCPAYSIEMDMKQTVLNLETRQRDFLFGCSTVWSDPIAYQYLGNSSWNGNAQIVSVLDAELPIPDQSAPEPSAAMLTIPALGMMVWRVKRQRSPQENR